MFYNIFICYFKQNQGTGARLGGFLSDEYDWAEELGTAWYRSKEKVPISYAFLGGGALSSKKWPLIEESSIFSHYIHSPQYFFQILTQHLLIFQQVNRIFRVFRKQILVEMAKVLSY